MKHYRLLFTLIACLLGWASVFATPRSYIQALAIARQQAELLGTTVENLADSTASARQRKLSAKLHLSQHAFLFTHAGQKGFTVVAADDRMPDVIAYSDRGTLDEAHLSDGFRYYMQAYARLAEAVQRGDAAALRQVAEMQAVRQNRKVGNVCIEPLVHTLWNQGSPYNNQCPRIDGQPTYTGCVATALAQVMAYHHWPAKLQTTIPAYTTATAHIAMPAIPAGTQYRWDRMIDSYGASGSYTGEQAKAVAQLMYHVGQAMKMDYGTNSSWSNYQTDALVKYFDYDPELMQLVSRSSFTLEQWLSLMDTELQASRPICVSGNNGVSGHAFVCDGADGQGLYHFNWGWGGFQDGYFDVGVLNPVKGGIGSGSGIDGYANNMQMIIGFTPDNGVADDPLVTSGGNDLCLLWNTEMPVVFSRSVRTGATQPFQFTVKASIYNSSSRDIEHFDWNIGIRLADGTYAPLGDGYEDVTLPAQKDNVVHFYKDIDFPCTYALPEGQYMLYSIVREQGGQWHPCGNVYGVKLPVLRVTANTATDVTGEMTLRADIQPEASTVETGKDHTFTLTLNNANGNAYVGKLYFYLSDRPDVSTRTLVHNRYAVVQTDETQTLTVSLAMGDAIRQYIWVECDEGVLVDAQPIDLNVSQKPILSLVNITANDSKSQLYSGLMMNGRPIGIPYIDDTQATVTYHLQNDGSAADVAATFAVYNPLNGELLKEYANAVQHVPGNHAVTAFTVQIPHELSAYPFLMCVLYTTPEFETLYTQKVPYLDKDDDYAGLGASEYLFYISGNATGIGNACADGTAVVSVSGQRGCLLVSTATTRRVDVYSMDGQLVAQPVCPAGQTIRQPLPPGLYIVAGKKILVR